MEPFGYKLLARTALPDHEDRAVQRSSAAGTFERIEKGTGLTNYL